MAEVATVLVSRSGPAIREALVDHGRPGDVDRFEAELREALTAAVDDLDVARAERVLRRWQARAIMLANPLTADEHAQLARARAGDVTGLYSPDEPGRAAAV